MSRITQRHTWDVIDKAGNWLQNLNLAMAYLDIRLIQNNEKKGTDLNQSCGTMPYTNAIIP